jgi:hypothetical protein
MICHPIDIVTRCFLSHCRSLQFVGRANSPRWFVRRVGRSRNPKRTEWEKPDDEGRTEKTAIGIAMMRCDTSMASSIGRKNDDGLHWWKDAEDLIAMATRLVLPR